MSNDKDFALRVGNHELTNLLVQTHVRRVEERIEELHALIEQTKANMEETLVTFNLVMNDLVRAEYIPKIKVAEEAIFALGYMANVDHKGITYYYSDCDMSEWGVGYRSSPWRRTKPGDTFRVSVNIYHPKANEFKILLTLTEAIPVTLTAQLQSLDINLFELGQAIIVAQNERVELQQSIKYTSVVEKRILAELTKRTIESNPAALALLNEIVDGFELNGKQITMKRS